MEFLTQIRWSPYWVGAGIGVLSWFMFLILKKPLGCSTAFARSSGMIASLFAKQKIKDNVYFKEFKPMIDWEWMLVLGVVIGAFVSAMISGDFQWQWVSGQWSNSFGNAPLPRIITALIGGIFMGFGSRWSGGCTSGHGISGTLQLAVSGWISAIFFFIGGILTAFLIFKVIA